MSKIVAQLALTAAIEGIKLYHSYRDIASRTGELTDEERAENDKQLSDAMAADRWKRDEELKKG